MLGQIAPPPSLIGIPIAGFTDPHVRGKLLSPIRARWHTRALSSIVKQASIMSAWVIEASI